ncbi:MAG: T9SS type A sorting domain-containing protein [Ignavibacteriae bacterium]|nr:T9SS type A sorting domain-containing protein [Ignavibacteriota bacterium]
MKKALLIVVLLCAVLVVYYEASGWGWDTHYFINRKTVYHLPSQMMLFIQDSLFFQDHAEDADRRVNSADTSLYAERPRHFMDIDDYPNFRNLTRSLDTLILLYGRERVKDNGTNPWATVWVYDTLVAQLRRGDWNNAKLTAADLGHYVGDAHQPLHNTWNYNPGGLHSRYETTMLSTTYYLSQLFITPDSVRYIADRINFIFDYILHSNSYVDTLLVADAYARSVSGGTYNATYYNALWLKTRSITLEQVQRATHDLASLWYSAWVDAGLISTTGVLPPVATTPVELSLAQNYPNPFNPATMISYSLPVGGTVSLKIFSVDGREIATLVQENQSAGNHAVQFSASASLASGVYLYQLRLGNFSQTKKFVLLK